MLINCNFRGYILFLFFIFSTTVLSQPSLPCDDCGTTGTLEGPYTSIISIDTTTANGCNVTIEYYKRSCKGFTNVYITNYKMIGSNCSTMSDNTKIDRALSGMLHEGTVPLPPYETTDSPACWRIRRPACWQKSELSSDTSTYSSCPSSECCDTYFKATAGECGKIISYIPMKDPTECPIVSPPIDCIHSCGRDPLDAWRKD